MDKVIVYSQHLSLDSIENTEIVNIRTKEKLAKALVSEENIRCLVIDIPEISEDHISFFASVKTNFPLLEGIVLTPDTDRIIRGYRKADRNNPDYTSQIEEFIKNAQNRNKRAGNRFSWPLTAWFSSDDIDWQELEIFSVSSGGAYLKTETIMPVWGSHANVKIIFANFSLETSCEIVDSESRSSNYPFGFGIRFLSVSEEGKVILNKLINDAVIRILLEPDSEPEIPSLGGGELAPDFTIL